MQLEGQERLKAVAMLRLDKQHLPEEMIWGVIGMI